MSTAEEPYIVITADTHAGNSIDGYREYLDPAFRDVFDAWRARSRASHHTSKKHSDSRRKMRNWDPEIRRTDLLDDGVVGEVIFPNTVPPFYPKPFHIAAPPTPAQYRSFRAGTRAHNRWLAEFCQEDPVARAGIGLIHLNDLDDAIEDVKWIAENGLRGGICLPLPAPSDVHLPFLNDRKLDRLWAVIQDHDLVLNQHSGQGSPTYSADQGRNALWAMEMPFYVQRGCSMLVMGGVFERFPRLRYILTESGCAWAEDLMARMDGMYLAWKMNAIGEIDTSQDPPIEELPSYYMKRNCWYGASFPSPDDVASRHAVSLDRVLWGNDYPHYEGCFPYSRENMRFAFADVSEKEVRMMLGENAAALYGFDLDVLRERAGKVGIMPSLVREPLLEIPGDSTCITFLRARAEQANR